MKKFITILFTVLLLIGVSGCHGSRSSLNTFEVPEEFDTSRDYEIVFWAKNESNKVQVAAYEKAVSDFETLYPNIKVTIKSYTKYPDIYNDVITNISTNTTPNVCITYPDHIATYLTGNSIMVELDDLMADEKYGMGGSALKYDSASKDEYVSEFLNECIINDHYYALPYMRSTEALYMNVDMIEKLGYEIPEVLTWDFVFEVADKATEKNEDGTYKINGQKTMIPFMYKSTDNMMISMLRQLNAGYSNDDGDILIFNDTTKDLLTEIASHVENGAFSTFAISSYPANFLNAGQCIFAIDSTAGATWMGSECPMLDIAEEKVVKFNIAVKPIPQYDINNPLMISQGPSICIFNKEDPQVVLASWLFAQFLLTNDVQIAYSKTEGYIPVTTKAQNSDAYQDYLNRAGEDNDEHYSVKLDATKLLIDNTSNTFVTPVFNGSTSLREAAGDMIESVCMAVKKHKTIDDEYFKGLFEQMNDEYHLDQIALVK